MKKKQVSEKELIATIIESIQDRKGHDVVHLDLRGIEEAVTDNFIICHGDSNTQTSAIVDGILKDVKEQYGLYPNYKEGMTNNEWVLLDFFDVVVHVFYREARKFYQLEDLWCDAKTTHFEDDAPKAARI